MSTGRSAQPELTQAGLQRAKASRKALGRPEALTSDQQKEIIAAHGKGVSLGVLATQYNVSRAAIQRVEKRAA
ncbi:helix-turn-helix domain-containing protein [Sphingomonas endophytica]|uniref:helix-turn-helix domain-containing protein n=1 Tax=Sphingomonas endophytica TaxID=869719 RepID=UPI0035D93474